MEVVIFCGGKGTRLKPYLKELPKPLILIGDRSILWHIMKRFSKYGHKQFILCLGYMGEKIKEYFQNSYNIEEDWEIKFVDTGLESNKGERLKKVENLIKGDTFFVSYGDDISDVEIDGLLNFHLKNKKIATLTAVNPISEFGIIEIAKDGVIQEFKEKPKMKYWINGGYFVFNKQIFDYIKDGWDLEKETFKSLVDKKQINAFKHFGFWACMNTFKDVISLNEMWNKNELKRILYTNIEKKRN